MADGYVNHRVIVFDATTGAYKRHWGAYGKRPDDGYFTQAGERLPSPFSGAVQNENKPSNYDPDVPPPPQFRIVHAVRIARDGLVYVCDRTNDRVQVFRKDGTFVKEAFVAKKTLGSGSVWDIVFSTDPAQKYLIVNDGTNQQIWVLLRDTLRGGERIRPAPDIRPDSSTARTSWRRTRRATCSSAKPTRASGCRSSRTAASAPRWRR